MAMTLTRSPLETALVLVFSLVAGMVLRSYVLPWLPPSAVADLLQLSATLTVLLGGLIVVTKTEDAAYRSPRWLTPSTGSSVIRCADKASMWTLMIESKQQGAKVISPPRSRNNSAASRAQTHWHQEQTQTKGGSQAQLQYKQQVHRSGSGSAGGGGGSVQEDVVPETISRAAKQDRVLAMKRWKVWVLSLHRSSSGDKSCDRSPVSSDAELTSREELWLPSLRRSFARESSRDERPPSTDTEAITCQKKWLKGWSRYSRQSRDSMGSKDDRSRVKARSSNRSESF